MRISSAQAGPAGSAMSWRNVYEWAACPALLLIESLSACSAAEADEEACDEGQCQKRDRGDRRPRGPREPDDLFRVEPPKRAGREVCKEGIVEASAAFAVG